LVNAAIHRPPTAEAAAASPNSRYTDGPNV
jgi:hypothetical protein